MRNGSLRYKLVLAKKVIFLEFDFETSDLELEGSKSSIWKHPYSCNKGVFLSLLSCNFDDWLSPNFHRCVILCILCWDTASEKTGLWQLPILSSVFKKMLIIVKCKFIKLSPSCFSFIGFNATKISLEGTPFCFDIKF